MQPAARTAAILCLSVPLALCLPSTPARADYDAITSEPQAEPAPPADVPFFGEPVIVPEEPPARPKPEKPVRAERQKEPKEPAPSPQQAQKAEKPKPVPQAQAKPQKPRPGRLEIPAEAQKKRDLSFLEGCWYFEDELMKIDNARRDNHGMGREWYCFNKNGVRKQVTKKMFPGYVLINMVMNDDTWYVVRNTRGVTGFVGPGSKPVPLSDLEMRSLGIRTDAPVEVDFDEGDTVSVIGGVWKDTIGVITGMNHGKQTVTINVEMFGRETPVEISFADVKKM